jgi:dolichyl-phosphate beta-glucosyltransferase
MKQPEIDLSVIVPVYNEAERLPRTLARLHQFLSGESFAYEIIVVLDGPTDGTRAILRRMGSGIAHLRVIDRAVNRGKGYTVKQGMLEARGRVRLFTDADNSTDVAHFNLMKPLFDDGCHLVIASRNAKDVAGARQRVPQSRYKRWIGLAGNLIVQLVAVPRIWDTQCGFKAFRAEAAEQVFSQTRIEGWGFDIEVLALARALDIKIGIIPADWVNDNRSHFRFFDYVRVLTDTIRVRRNFAARRYRV